MGFFWEKTGWEDEDKHLKSLQQAPFARPFKPLVLRQGLQIIRGPRQIGKSSWMKQLLSQACAAQKKCFFYACDDLEDFRELNNVLQPQLKNCEYIFLDEITFVKNWWRCLKKIIDSGYSGKIVITGSNTFDLRKGMDSMPGRWAKGGGEYVLLPMDFFEWKSMKKIAGWPLHNSVKDLEDYFRIGGFPIALREAGADNKNPKESKHTLWRWILGDCLRRGKQEKFLKELLIELAGLHTGRISYHKLAQKTQIMSYNTVHEYVNLLEDCFALKILYALDPNTAKTQYKKDKKFYFRDPLIFHMAHELSPQQKQAEHYEKLAELVAHEWLVQNKQNFGYFSSTKGEVDFYSPQQWAIEVKWSDVPKNLSKAYHQLILPQKKVWCKSNFFE